MKDSLGLSAKGKIGALLVVVLSAVLFGGLAAVLMVINYSPSATYLLKNILLSPDVAETLDGKPVYFDHIEFSRWDPIGRGMLTDVVDMEKYRTFYKSVEGDRSLEEVPAELSADFYRAHPSRITLFVRSEGSSSKIKPFQTVEFAPENDYFRVEMHVDSYDQESKWAYFYHPQTALRFKTLFSEREKEPKRR